MKKENEMENVEIEKAETYSVEEYTAEDVEDRLVFDLSRHFVFEGKEYKKIDLTPLKDVCATDMIAVNRRMSRNGNNDLAPELTLEYACEIAAQMTDLPVEFYKSLPMRDAMKLKGRVTGFMFGEI